MKGRMTMRVGLGLAATLTLTVFAGCLTEDARAASIEAPSWTSGYAYAHEAVAEVQASATVDGKSHEEKSGPIKIRTHSEVVNTTFLADGEPLYLLVITSDGAPSAVTTDGEGTIWTTNHALVAVRQRDLAPVPHTPSLVFTCHASAPSNAPDPRCNTGVSDITFGPAPKATFLDFPLVTGKKWGAVMDPGEDPAFGQFEGDLSWQMSARVKGEKETTGPQGDPVPAVLIEFVYSPLNVEEVKRVARKGIEAKGAEVDALDLDARATHTVYYSSVYQAPVRETVDAYVRFHLKVTDKGETHEVRTDVQLHATFTLTGAQLVSKPERDLQYIGQLLTGATPVADPTGKAWEPVGYALDLVSSKAGVNAAQPADVAFTTTVAGTMPTDHVVHWRILDAMRTVAAEGDGLDFTHSFKEPGRFSIEVEATTPSGATAAADAVEVVAGYDATIALSCGPVGAESLIGGCDDVKVPVRPGLRSIVAQLSLNPLTSQTSMGRLSVADAAGTRQETVGYGPGPHTIMVDDFSTFKVGRDDWNVDWEEWAAVADEPQLHITLDYGTYDAPVSYSAAWDAAPAGPMLRGVGGPSVDMVPTMDGPIREALSLAGGWF